MTTIEELIERERARGQYFGPWEQHWTLQTRSPERVKKLLHLAKEHPHLLGMPQQGFAGLISKKQTGAFGARNTSASELNILQDGVTGASAATHQSIVDQYCKIAPQEVDVGKIFRLEASGIYSNTSTPTIIWTPRWGSSTTVATNISLGASGTFTTITSTTNLPWDILLKVHVRTEPPGATVATVYATGIVTLGIPVTSSQFCTDLYWGGGTAATTVDGSGQGTAGCGITANITWGTSSASNTLTTQLWAIYSMN